MAEKVVHTGNYNIQVVIKYEFSSNSTNRTWGLSADLYVRVPSNFNIGPWGNFGSNTGNLVGGAIGNISTGDHKLAGPYTTSGNYDANGTAPSVTITWAWNVNSSWGGCVYPHGSTTVTGSSIGSANCTVSYNANGGSSTPASQTVQIGKAMTLAAAISRAESTSTGTITLSYDANGGSGAPGSQNGAYTNATPYTFAGWAAGSTSGQKYNGGASYTPTGNITFYATWNTGTTYRKTNPSLTISGTKPTRTYYTFKNWNTASNGSGSSYNPSGSITISGNTTLYAQWTPNAPINLTIVRTGGSTTSIDLQVSATGLTMTNYTIYYRVNGSTGSYSSKSFGTSTTGSITGLAVDTDYQIYFTATNAGGTTESAKVIFSTLLNNPTITTPTKKNTFPYMTTISATGSITPSRTLSYAFSKDGGSTWTGYQSSNSYQWTGLNQETTYNMGVRVKATKVGTNAVDTYATSYLSVTTPTDQVRFRIKDGGQWKKGRAYLKVNGVWKKGIRAFIKINGEWVENENFYDGEPSLWD